MQKIAILGSTGSIGTSCLEVIHAARDRMSVYGLAANTSWESLAEQASATHPRHVMLADLNVREQLDQARFPSGSRLSYGSDAIEQLASDPEVDCVVSAIVGAAGLHGTWAAVEAGKRVAVANKETYVLAGPLVTALAEKTGATLIPVDSEHSAIYQAMHSGKSSEVRRIVLTASGGPFWNKPDIDLSTITPAEALRHPTWDMGPTITIDSACMMNKAMEIIEARWMFDLDATQIEVMIHPQSIVHSFVEFIDGSVIAQLSPPDMKLPIQYALTWPDRTEGVAPSMSWSEAFSLDFHPPDLERFPALELGFEVAARGGTCGAVLNAAKEVAVQRFLDGTLAFSDIPRACRDLLNHHNYDPRPGLSQLLQLDARVREELARWKP